ncbi:MAG: cupin domain-containing protein [Clostridia bacterium]|nr:cupin domain-containing protein [Clostridia bacterium]
MQQQRPQVSARITELREILELSQQDVADKLGVDLDTYKAYESGEKDIPISMLYEVASMMNTNLTVLLTGEDAKMDSVSVCRDGKGVEVQRYPGYRFTSLAYNFKNRVMEPLLVSLDKDDDPVKLVSHGGQEYNYVIEGSVKVTIGKNEYILNKGDSIYFDPKTPHGQSAVSDKAQFITIIQE